MTTLSCVIDILLESILRQSNQGKGFHTAKTQSGHWWVLACGGLSAYATDIGGLGSVLAIQFSRLDSILQKTTLMWPSGDPSNSAMLEVLKEVVPHVSL